MNTRGGRLTPILWIGVAAVAAAVAVVAVVVPVAPTAGDAAPASASDALLAAADVTIHALDAELKPGEYLRIERQDAGFNYWLADAAAMGGAEGGWDVATSAMCTPRDPEAPLVAPLADAALLHRSWTVWYVPADRADDWVVEHGRREIVADYGERTDEALSLWPSASRWPDSPQILRFPGGRTGPAEAPDLAFVDDLRPYYDEMPRDPAALLTWFRDRRQLAPGATADDYAVFDITMSLSALLAPADLRASMLRAIALIDRVDLISVGDGTATLRYEYSYYQSCWGSITLDLDTVRGLITGLRYDDRMRLPHVVPSTAPPAGTTIDLTIVEAAP